MIDSFQKVRHFRQEEFTHPEDMLPHFLDLLDAVRDIAATPFRVTSDFRTPEENKIVGGSSTSLHMQGNAIDFVIWPWTAERLWALTRAVVFVGEAYGVTFELEISQSPSDRHVHLGLQQPTMPGELIFMYERAV